MRRRDVGIREEVTTDRLGGGQPPTAVPDSGGPLSSTKRIGSFQRRSIRSIVERTIPRVHTEALVVLPNDPNELTHAILAALFKPEVAQQKIEAARQTISKFHPRQRLRALQQMLTTAKR